jgi:hypothetical protein
LPDDVYLEEPFSEIDTTGEDSVNPYPETKHVVGYKHTHIIIMIIKHSADPKFSQVTKECGTSHRNTKYTELLCYKCIIRMSHIILTALYIAEKRLSHIRILEIQVNIKVGCRFYWMCHCAAE